VLRCARTYYTFHLGIGTVALGCDVGRVPAETHADLRPPRNSTHADGRTKPKRSAGASRDPAHSSTARASGAGAPAQL